MEKRIRIWGKPATAVAAAFILLLQVGANAQGLTDRERQLLDAVERLEKRIESLESGHKDKSIAEESIRERVSGLEESLENTPAAAADTDMRVYWKDGLRFDTNDGKMKLRIGGRIMNDWGWFNEDADAPSASSKGAYYDGTPGFDIEDGTEFRRARLYVSGTIYDRYSFKAQYDFAGGDADFKDMYIAMNKVPVVGQIKVGHFNEPFSLEQLTSSKYITFMERSLIAEGAFAPSRNTGIQISNTAFNNRMTWAAGIFRTANGYGDDKADDGGYSVTGRVTGLPWYKDEGRRLVHLGAAYSHRNPDSVRYRQRPEAHLTTRFVNTGTIATDSVDLFGAEAALVLGPFSLQGEYSHASVDTAGGGDADFSGYYAAASYFLTGEHRPYSTSKGSFGRVKPKNDFTWWGENRGPGAWEVALRYSHLDLEDGSIFGGEEDNITLGVNWYLNRYTRVMLNYIHAEVDRGVIDGDIDAVQARFQIDF